MRRRFWLIIGLVALLLVVAVVGGGAGLLFYGRYRIQQYHDRGEQLFAKGEWDLAKRNFRIYLSKHPEDVNILEKFAQASDHLWENRNMALRDVGGAYYQISITQPDNEAARERLLQLYTRTRFWGEVQYYASLFLRSRPDSQMLQYYNAVSLDKLGRRNDAITAYTGLVAAGTQHADVYGNLARLLRGQGLQDQADAIMAQAMEQHPDDPQTYLERARFAFDGKDIKTAEKEIGEAMQRAPDEPDVLLMAAQVDIEKRDWEGVLALGLKALAQAPDDPDAYLIVARAYQEMGQSEKAIELLETPDLRLRADFPQLFIALAELQIATGRMEDAEKTEALYKKARPEHLPMFDYLDGRMLLARGDPAAAATRLTAVVQANPSFGPAQFFQAVAYLQSRQRDRARVALDAYLRNYPEDQAARVLWRREFSPPRSPEQMAADIQTLLNDPNATPDNLVASAVSLLNEGLRGGNPTRTTGAAKKLLDLATQRNPPSTEAYRILAELLLSEGKSPEAREVLARAAAAGIPEDNFRWARANIALTEGHLEQAKALFQEDFSHPDMPVNEMARWGRLFAQRGNLDTAMDVLSQGILREHGEARDMLVREQVSLCLQAGDVNRALANLEALARNASLGADAPHLVNQAKLQLAWGLVQPGANQDLASAEGLAREVEQDETDAPAAQLVQARVLLQRTPPDREAARALLARVLEADPSDTNALLALAEIAAQEDNLAQALEYAKRAVSSTQLLGSGPQYLLADVQMRLQLYPDAQLTLENILAGRPDDTRAMEMLLRNYAFTGQYQQADAMLARLEKALDNPGVASQLDALRSWLMLTEGKDLPEAEGLMRAQLEAKPDDVSVLSDLVKVVAAQGRRGEAETLLKDFTAHHPSNAEAWTILGQFYLDAFRRKLARPQLASSAFVRALLAVPDYPAALRGLIELQLLTGNFAQAMGLCDRYLAQKPDDVAVLYRKAFLQSQQPLQLANALKTISKVLALSDQPEYFLLRGDIRLRLGQYPEALADLQQVVNAQHGATSAGLDAGLAEAYLRTGDRDLAEQYYESALAKSATGQQVDPNRLKALKELLEKAKDQA